ncbi:MAG: Trk system potassium transporter TrkA [Lachnospiraceae bacterium]|nr:Trk system potassium transporter TrkA [Lachnospiraceae bacterium]
MKIIIVGCGKVGLTLAEQLTKEKHNVTVIDTNYNKLRAVTDSIDVMCIEGNGISTPILMEAGIDTADILIATMENDEKNVMCTLVAKQLGHCQAIARIRSAAYVDEIRNIKDQLNMSIVLNPDKAAAEEIGKLVAFPSSVKRIDSFARGRINVVAVTLPEESLLEGYRIRDLSRVIKANILICAIERDGDVIIPDGNSILHGGDTISFVGLHTQQNLFFKELKMTTGLPKSVMIIGGSNIAYYLAKAIESTTSVKIIDSDLERCKELSTILDKTTIINGDASDQQLLLEEGIESTDAVVTLTGIDEENIMISLYASSVSQARVITKINRITFENVISTLDVGSVVNPKVITADHITQYVRGMQNSLGSNIETLYTFASGKAEALEFRVTKEFQKLHTPIMDIALKKNLLLACIYRNGRVIVPGGHDTLEVADTVIVVTTQTGLNDLNDVLE